MDEKDFVFKNDFKNRYDTKVSSATGCYNQDSLFAPLFEAITFE
jgi:hypothetical protein